MAADFSMATVWPKEDVDVMAWNVVGSIRRQAAVAVPLSPFGLGRLSCQVGPHDSANKSGRSDECLSVDARRCQAMPADKAQSSNAEKLSALCLLTLLKRQSFNSRNLADISFNSCSGVQLCTVIIITIDQSKVEI